MGAPEVAVLVVAAVGVAGTVLPLLPGAGLILAATVVYAWWTGFQILSGADLALLTGLAIASYVADLVLGVGGARRFGAGRPGMIGAVVGLFAGLIVTGPFGIVLGPIIGAALGELLYGRHWRVAVRAGLGAGIGTLLAAAVRLVFGVLMFGYLLWEVVFAAR